VLFSNLTVWELCDPTFSPKKANLDRHHLFPKAYLKKLGIDDRRMINRIANTTLLEWPDNIKIGAKSPVDYLSAIRPRFSDEAWGRMSEDHALPEDWVAMEYPEFLEARRHLMAKVIRRAFDKLRV
jgi:hypothetical protein